MTNDSPDMSDFPRVKPKRRRVLYSCESCRSKKLKCDRERPSCGTCAKQGTRCRYIESSALKDDSIEEQLEILKAKISDLERKRATMGKATPRINMSHVLSFPGLVLRNIYLNIYRVDSNRRNVKIPSRIEEMIEKDKTEVSDFELMKHDLRVNKMNVSDLIINYLTDKKPWLWQLINHFFNSELYITFSCIDRNSFYLKATEFLHKIDAKGTVSKPEYILSGIIIAITRISYLSLYNCGYKPTIDIDAAGADALSLALLCLNEGQSLFRHDETDDFMDLMILIFFCEDFSTEITCPMVLNRKITLEEIRQKFIIFELNIDPGSNSTEADLRRRRWYQFLEIQRVEFLYNNIPIQVDPQKYTTSLPNVLRVPTDEDFINQMYHERFKIEDLLEQLSKMINNVRASYTYEDFEAYIRNVRDANVPLDQILSLDSTTKQSRWKKSVKFLNYLDLSCVEYMVGIHLFLDFESENEIGTREDDLLLFVAQNVSQNLKLAYFLDSQQQHFYNLQEHFGYSVELIPRIIYTLHRCIQFQITVLTKLLLMSDRTSPAPLCAQELKNVLFQNIKVVVSSWGRISDRYIYAKRIYMIISYLILEMFGPDLKSRPEHVNGVYSDKLLPLNESTTKALLKTMTELTGQRDITEDPYKEPLTDYFCQVFNNDGNEPLEFNLSAIENIERFLNDQSFLNGEL